MTGLALDGATLYLVGRMADALPGQTTAGRDDAFIRRYRDDGEELWTRQLGTERFNSAHAVAIAGEGVYVAGGWQDSIRHGAFVRRYTPEGDEVWTDVFDIKSAIHDVDVAADGAGVYVVAGGQGPDRTDSSLRRYEPDGTEAWVRGVGIETDHQALAVAADPAGVYVAGVYVAEDGEGEKGFVRRFSPDGAEGRTFTFSTGYDVVFPSVVVTSVALSPASVHLAGVATGAFPGQANADDRLHDVFLMRLPRDPD